MCFSYITTWQGLTLALLAVQDGWNHALKAGTNPCTLFPLQQNFPIHWSIWIQALHQSLESHCAEAWSQHSSRCMLMILRCMCHVILMMSVDSGIAQLKHAEEIWVWMKANSLKLNDSKTEFITIASKHHLSQLGGIEIKIGSRVHTIIK